MNTRIKELRKSLNLTQLEFGNAIGLRSSISDIELGKAPITKRTIIAICSKFNVNEDWLRNGKGQMFVNEDKKFTEFYEIYKSLTTPLQDFLIQTAKNLLETQDKLKPSGKL